MLRTNIKNLSGNQIGTKFDMNQQMKQKIADSPDTVYFNVTIPYTANATGISPAIYQSQLSQPILSNPQEYYMAMVRFQVSGVNIPIFIPRIQPFPNTNLNNTIYSVTLGYNGAFSQAFVQYVPNDLTAQPSAPLSATHTTVDYTSYYFVYTYTHFIMMVNTALATAFAALPGAPGGSVAPYFIYDPQTQLISLIASEAFYNLGPGGPATPITVYCNSVLFHFFDGIPIILRGLGTANGADEQFEIRNQNDTNWYNPPGPTDPASNYPLTLLQMEQEYNTLQNWNTLQTVQLVSNLLPINREYVPPASSNNSGVVSSIGVLADFIPFASGAEFRTTIDFVSDGPWRLIDMYGNTPVTRVDLYFYWTDDIGTQRVINIGVDKSATAKMMFIKKDLIRGLSAMDG